MSIGMTPAQTYESLMQRLLGRFDVITAVKASGADDFSRAETAAFHGRKAVEGIAFACLVAIENGIQVVPRDTRGQWNAEEIFKSLTKKGLDVLPSPSLIRYATAEEKAESGAGIVVEGIPERRLSHEQLISIYQQLHTWAHEINPYTQNEHAAFYAKHSPTLWEDLTRLEVFVEQHFISIRGKAFFCVLRDTQDRMTKVLPLAKMQSNNALQPPREDTRG